MKRTIILALVLVSVVVGGLLVADNVATSPNGRFYKMDKVALVKADYTVDVILNKGEVDEQTISAHTYQLDSAEGTVIDMYVTVKGRVK